jgi:HD-GYP domain-containing protein (c-di-GMP phosphodiesterase class II)
MSEPLRVTLPAPEDDELQAIGREIARTFLLALRTFRSHGAQNQVAVAAVKGLARALNQGVLRNGGSELRVVEDFIYFGSQRLRLPRSDERMVGIVVQELTRRGIGSISLSIATTEAQVTALLESLGRHHEGGEDCFHRLYAETRPAGSPFMLAQPKGLGAGGPRDQDAAAVVMFPEGGVGVGPGDADEETPMGKAGAGGNDQDQAKRGPRLPFRTTGMEMEDGFGAPAAHGLRDRCRSAFFTALAVHRAYYRGAQQGEPLPLRHAKRTVQSLVEVVLEGESAILGLTTLKAHDNFAFFHSVNVCVLSVGLGKRLGLDRAQLVDLGIAALLHDLGKAVVPAGIFGKGDALTPEESAQIQRHPHLGVRELLRLGGLSQQLYPAMVGCFEHHMNCDGMGQGYPKLAEPYRPHLFGRIVAIADCFDALSAKRVYRKRAQSHDETLAYLLSLAGTKFDSVLVRLFVNLVGVYPVGSVVRLRSGRVGVVVSSPQAPGQCRRPLVRLLDPCTHEPLPEQVDLSREEGNAAEREAITAILDAEQERIDLKRVFL